MCRHSHKNDRFSKEIRKIAKITLVVSEKNRIFALQLRRLVALLENKASFIHSLAQPLHRLSEERTFGQIPEWPNGADCKSAVFRLRWFESIFAHKNEERIAPLVFALVKVLSLPRKHNSTTVRHPKHSSERMLTLDQPIQESHVEASRKEFHPLKCQDITRKSPSNFTQ